MPPKQAKQFPLSVKKGKIDVEDVSGRNMRTVEVGTDVSDAMIAPGVSGSLSEPIAVVALRWVTATGGLSARALANDAVRDWSDDFMFIIGDHRYRCRLSVA
jgi:energy-converting hydrogenase Eha subunit G